MTSTHQVQCNTLYAVVDAAAECDSSSDGRWGITLCPDYKKVQDVVNPANNRQFVCDVLPPEDDAPRMLALSLTGCRLHGAHVCLSV